MYCCQTFEHAVSEGNIELCVDGSFVVPAGDKQLMIWGCEFCPWCGAKKTGNI